jgi:RNA polymerase sigma-70 factor, ECF subfamily
MSARSSRPQIDRPTDRDRDRDAATPSDGPVSRVGMTSEVRTRVASVPDLATSEALRTVQAGAAANQAGFESEDTPSADLVDDEADPLSTTDATFASVDLPEDLALALSHPAAAIPRGRGRAPGPDTVNSAAPASSNREARKREAEEDRVLMESAKQGDRAAFRTLVERHERRAFVIAVGLLRDEADAHEVVQEAFLRVYRGLDKFQGTSSFFTWLYRIISNLSIDVMRRPGRYVAPEPEDGQLGLRGIDEADYPLLSRIDGADPLDRLHRARLADRIRTALDALPPYHRGVIVMREIEGLSYEEMAEAMGVSKGTIMSRLFHARQKMQRALADCYAELPSSTERSSTVRGAAGVEADALISLAEQAHDDEGALLALSTKRRSGTVPS